ncbi:MAG: diacylglycerol kinase family lipid kinase [Eggerthellaceae bacterium]|nr:diacylglycerol kinase family lipid kinase [Eggerthellaceae bacterium]
MAHEWGRVLLIANPAAQNGRGADAAAEASVLLREALPASTVEVQPTAGPGHGRELAAAAADFDTVIALGGDGIIHEVVNGLMTLPANERPYLGIIPVGSGNDYAATLSMERDVVRAVAQLVDARAVSVDVGCCNGVYFAETVSFGLDAAIALDTVERRKRTGRTGTMLYLAAGLDQLMNHLDCRRYRVAFDDGGFHEGEMYLFAVQNGPTYGGGFTVAPKASIADGWLDVVIAHPPLSRKKATLIFMLAKDGHHTRFKQLEFRRAHRLRVEFDEPLPVQVDGERLEGTSFELSVAPRALRVLVPPQARPSVVEGPEPHGYVHVPEDGEGRRS